MYVKMRRFGADQTESGNHRGPSRQASRQGKQMKLWALGCIAALSVRAYRRKTLTPLGVGAAVIVSSLYTLHPWGVFLVLLLAFYITSTFFTKVLLSLVVIANVAV